jgi:hypothetical protein
MHCDKRLPPRRKSELVPASSAETVAVKGIIQPNCTGVKGFVALNINTEAFGTRTCTILKKNIVVIGSTFTGHNETFQVFIYLCTQLFECQLGSKQAEKKRTKQTMTIKIHFVLL